MTEAQKAALAAEEKAFQDSLIGLDETTKATVIAARNAFTDKLQTVQAEMLTKEEAEPMFTKMLEEYKDLPQALNTVKELLAKHGKTLTAMKSGLTGPSTPETFKQVVSKAIEDHADEIAKSINGNPVKLEFTTDTTNKAVGTVTVASGAAPDGLNALIGIQAAPPSDAAIREDNLMDLVTNLQTNQAAYPYTETLPKDGDFAFQTAEGAAKAQIDFKTETRYATPVTLAAYEVLTNQSVQDIPGLQSIAQNILFKKHGRKKNKAILFGTNASGECKGATLYASAFTAPSALQNVVENPNIMDVINAVITGIYMTHDYVDQLGYKANVCLINPYDFYVEFSAAKDGFGRPLYPTASLFNQVTIGGVTIRPYEDITAGSIFVADMSKYNVSNYVGYTITIGRINDDLIKNQFVMLGESRFHAFVKKLDEKAFVYDTIANIRGQIQKAS